MTDRILITGGSGFIGTNLVSHCLDRHLGAVMNVDSRPPHMDEHSGLWVDANLQKLDDLMNIFGEFQPTQVFHLAARTDLHGSRLSDYSDNTDGVRNVVEAVNATSSVQGAVFASSRMVCHIKYHPSSDTDYSPPNAYGASKVVGEKIVRAEARQGIWTIVRPTSIWGPWFGVPYRDFFDTIQRGYYFKVRGHENVTKSFGYVGNTVYQLVRLMSALPDIAGKTYYLADYSPTLVNSMADCVRDALGAPPIRVVPYSALKAAAGMGDLAKHLGWREPPITSFRLRNLLTDMVFDLSELESVVGPLPYTMSAGVRETANWMRTNGSPG